MKLHIAIGALVLLGFCGCSTVDPYTDTKIKNRLNAASKAGMSKDEIVAQVGLPAQKAPRADGGETWTYSFAKQEAVSQIDPKTFMITGSQIFDVALTITLGFNAAGAMDDWAYSGNILAFPEIAFKRMKVPAKGRAVPAPAATPAAAPAAAPAPAVAQDEIRMLTTNALVAAMKCGRIWEPYILKQIGLPQEIRPGDDGNGRKFVYRYDDPSSDPAKPRRFEIGATFNREGRMCGYIVTSPPGPFLLTPFRFLEVPTADDGAGRWVETAGKPGAMVWFRAFPAGYLIQYEGGEQPMPSGPALVHGKGVVRILDPMANEIGCYVGPFDRGAPAAGLIRLKKEAAAPAVPGLQLGGVPWE